MKKTFVKLCLFTLAVLALVGCVNKGDEPAPSNVEPTDIAISPEQESIILQVGDQLAIEPILTPANANKAYLTWQSNNANVCRVDQDGVITAVGFGKTVVTAMYGSLEAVVVVRVEESQRNYQLIWEDNFDGNSLNMNNWSYKTGTGFGNQEKQYCTSGTNNAYVRDGYLHIEAKKESYQGCNYTSARLESKDKVKMRYGKLEARISVPSGAGTWPAFWMMPNNNVYGNWPFSGEIDIMEHWGRESQIVSHAVHTANANGMGNHWSSKYNIAGLENNFHTFGIEWIENYQNGLDAIIFTFDGVKKATVNEKKNGTFKDWPFDQDFYIILNLAIGGSLGGNVNDAIFSSPVIMKVDWVRMYELVN